MKIIIKKQYYKRRRTGEEPIHYSAKQKGQVVRATVFMDPVLKKHDDLRKALFNHEKREISAWANEDTAAHSKAKSREPAVIRNIGGVSGFWKEIKRREKKTR